MMLVDMENLGFHMVMVEIWVMILLGWMLLVVLILLDLLGRLLIGEFWLGDIGMGLMSG